MSELKEVKYEILEVHVDKGLAKVKFFNPYREDDKDEVNIDHERLVKIPVKDGAADAEAFEEQLQQLSRAQSNKMLLVKENNKIAGEAAFASIIKMGKNVSIRNNESDQEVIEPNDVVEESVIEEPVEEVEVPVKPKPKPKLKPSKTTPPKKTASKAKTTSK